MARPTGGDRRLTLPNGLEVAYQSKAELQHFYDDIFEQRLYTRKGIHLRDGDCVFDVGANIGMFTLFVGHHHPGARIFSFEPAPPVFELLQVNTERLGGRVRRFNCGLAARPGTADLTFYPHSSGMSSFYPDEAQEKAALRTLIRGELARRAEVEQVLRYEEELVEQRLRSEVWTCELRTLSGVLREHGVDRIDLLKIDVEKSEMDVLAGLADDDWPKVAQIVAEVHDMGDRLRELPELLSFRGFQVELEQDELYRGSDRWSLRAVRPRPAARLVEVPAPAERPAEGLAVVGMAGRFPGAGDLDAFWRNLCNGVESIAVFSREELEAAGVDRALLDDSRYVPARGALEGIELFDAAFFGFNPREAELMDPQHRLFLECAWEALENAGYDALSYAGTIGVFGGMSMTHYLVSHLLAHPEVLAAAGPLQTRIYNDKDFLASMAAFKLGLTGPSVTVQTACSTSLVALCLACQSLLAYQCDMVLAGGVCVTLPQKAGYLALESVTSPDGHCRAFDAAAQGTVGGDGVGLVVLKRLADALADGDTIHAVVKGFATNNDGSLKLGYTTPGAEGQVEVVAMAQAVAGVAPETVGYVEAHGTGTPLGDPVEVAALAEVFGTGDDRRGSCALGSVKTNIGHLDAAAGVASLIKAALAVERGVLPPSLHFERPNPRIDFASTPFYVNAELRAWRPKGPRRAGVSAFAIGGVNAHVVLEEPPRAQEEEDPGPPWLLLPLSARTGDALEAMTERLARHLADRPEASLADAAWTLQAGRRAFGYRRVLVCRDRNDAVACLRGGDPRRLLGNTGEEMRDLPVAFLLSGLGNQHVGMAADLYRHLPRFREVLDGCAQGLRPWLGLDLREVLFPVGDHGSGGSGLDLRALVGRASGGSGASGTSRLDRTEISQPAVFAVEYALARLLMDLGVRPQALLGFSVGELVAACIAGVLSLQDALRLVAERARLIGELPAGAMLAVPLPEAEVRPFLAGGLSLAAVAGPELCVVAGPEPAVARVEQRLSGEGLVCRRLQTSHAFHSAMMEPAAGRLTALAASLELRPPEIPYISNVTGTWITAADATDPSYWARHLCGTVRFAEGLAELWREPGRLLVEAGPGQALSSWAVQHPQAPAGALAVPLMRHELDRQSDLAFLLTALGRLWLGGVSLDWAPLWEGQRRRRVALPTYPFERRRHWLEAGPLRSAVPATAAAARREDVGDWFWMPVWTQAPPLPPPAMRPTERRWLLIADENGLGERLAARLRRAGADVGLVRDGEALPDLASPGAPWTAIHLACASEADGAQQPEQPFASLLSVVQALSRAAAPAGLLVATRGLWRITGAEELRPLRATLLGPALVAPLEQPDLSARVVDVDSPVPGSTAEEDLLDDLVAEALAGGAERLSALRGGQRWLRAFEPVRLAAAAPALLVEEDVWLVTGGLGGVGLALAHRLAESAGVRLVLLGRQPLPEQGDGELAARRRMLRSIRDLGCEVLELVADVTDEAELARAVSAARQRFGRIDGVIHAAGVLPGGLLQTKTPEEARAVLAPKVAGTLALEKVLRDDPPKVMILCSSLSALGGAFGLSDHVAANAFLDAFAHLQEARNGRRGPWTLSVGWDAWLEVGQTARMARQLGLAPEAADGGTAAGGEAMTHPLLTRRRAEGSGREVFSGELATTSWVLDDHRVLGDGLLPGTAYIEMIRAACADRTDGATVVRRLGFSRPLRVRDGERLPVRVVVSGNGAGLDVAVESRSGQAWELHARARVEPGAGPAASRHDPRAVRERCPRRAPVERTASDGIRFGPRWRGLLRELSLGDGEGLALLELDERYGADLEGMPLHPALFDAATGFVQVAGEGGYLPLEYEEVCIRAPLPRRFYSHFHSLRVGDGGTLACDLALFDEGGEELVGIRGYTLRRLDPAAPPQELGPRPAADLHAAYAEGMAPEQGAEALLRLLTGAARVPHLAVSVSDLPARLRAAADMTARQVLEAAKEMRARADVHPRPGLHVPYEAPRDGNEEELAAVWQRILRLDRVGIHDSFFDLGGDSLLATQLISSVNEAFAVELTLRSVFEAPTVAELAREIARLLSGPEAGGRDRLPPIVRSEREGARPLSFAQRRLWLVEQLSPGTPAYNVPSAVLLAGLLDVPALARALEEIVRRHDSLRTRFPVADGEPLQEVVSHAARHLPILDLCGLPAEVRGRERDRLIRREAAAVFDLANGPLERRSLIRLGGTEHVLLLTLHHLVADRLSHDVVVAELSALYRAFAAGGPSPLPELEVQYPDFGEWQRDLLERGAWDSQMDHWRRALAGAPLFLELRLSRPRPPVPSFRAERRPVAVDREGAETLVRLGKAERSTLFMTLLAAFQVLLFHHSGEEDFVVGTSTSGRTRPETQGIIGFFANTLALRADLSGDPDFTAVLGRVREATLGAFANQDLPFDRILEELRVERDPARQPLFQVMFLLQEAAGEAEPLPGLEVRFLDEDPGTVKFDLTAFLFQGAAGISGWLMFNSDLFEATAMDRMTRDFHHLLRLVAEQPRRPLSAFCAALAQEDRGRRRQERDSMRQQHLQLLELVSREAVDHGTESPL